MGPNWSDTRNTAVLTKHQVNGCYFFVVVINSVNTLEWSTLWTSYQILVVFGLGYWLYSRFQNVAKLNKKAVEKNTHFTPIRDLCLVGQKGKYSQELSTFWGIPNFILFQWFGVSGILALALNSFSFFISSCVVGYLVHLLVFLKCNGMFYCSKFYSQDDAINNDNFFALTHFGPYIGSSALGLTVSCVLYQLLYSSVALAEGKECICGHVEKNVVMKNPQLGFTPAYESALQDKAYSKAHTVKKHQSMGPDFDIKKVKLEGLLNVDVIKMKTCSGCGLVEPEIKKRPPIDDVIGKPKKKAYVDINTNVGQSKPKSLFKEWTPPFGIEEPTFKYTRKDLLNFMPPFPRSVIDGFPITIYFETHRQYWGGDAWTWNQTGEMLRLAMLEYQKRDAWFNSHPEYRVQENPQYQRHVEFGRDYLAPAFNSWWNHGARDCKFIPEPPLAAMAVAFKKISTRPR